MPKIARIHKIIDRPQLGQPILDRRTRKRDAMFGREAAYGGRLFGLGVFDILRFVQADGCPCEVLAAVS